jgi:hypothetical protein
MWCPIYKRIAGKDFLVQWQGTQASRTNLWVMGELNLCLMCGKKNLLVLMGGWGEALAYVCSSSLVNLRLHTKNQPFNLPGSALKVWLGGGVENKFCDWLWIKPSPYFIWPIWIFHALSQGLDSSLHPELDLHSIRHMGGMSTSHLETQVFGLFREIFNPEHKQSPRVRVQVHPLGPLLGKAWPGSLKLIRLLIFLKVVKYTFYTKKKKKHRIMNTNKFTQVMAKKSCSL